MKNSTRLAALVLLLVAVTGSLAAKVTLARDHSLVLKPDARRFCRSVPPASGAMWLAGISGN